MTMKFSLTFHPNWCWLNKLQGPTRRQGWKTGLISYPYFQQFRLSSSFPSTIYTFRSLLSFSSLSLQLSITVLVRYQSRQYWWNIPPLEAAFPNSTLWNHLAYERTIWSNAHHTLKVYKSHYNDVLKINAAIEARMFWKKSCYCQRTRRKLLKSLSRRNP